jgi:hypothetical protein
LSVLFYTPAAAPDVLTRFFAIFHGFLRRD